MIHPRSTIYMEL
uniref:UBP21 n=1 Tax=Arundo donax TaxID=35708 RepID=A0A0A9F1G6_ARUDO